MESINPNTTITVTKVFKSILALHGIYGETQEQILLRLLPDDYATKFTGDKRITKIYSKEDVDSLKTKNKRRKDGI